MSTCLNCGAELDAGAKFCMECGTPVPQVKKCVQCGMELPLKAKFCFGCGAPQEGAPAGAGVSMGDKNVIAGDVVGQKVVGDNVQNKIMGNAIYNTIQDDTKRVNSCHVCGKHLTNVNGHTCPGCGNVVCDEHFDLQKNLCLKCVDAKKQGALKQYETALRSVGSNGQIDVIERNKLDVLANSLGLSKADILPLEQKFKLQVKVSTLTRTERMTLENVQKAYFEGKLEDSFEYIKNLFERYPNDEEVVSWYLRFARVLEPNETVDVIAKMQGEFCESYLSLTCIYLAKNQVSDAEVVLNKAREMWPESILVKCIEALLLFKLFKITAKSEFLSEADEILQGVGSLLDNYESFLVENERILLEHLQGNKSNWSIFDERFLDLIGYGLYIALSKEQLVQFIDEAIEENGLNCDLNFIDVSNVTDMSHLFETECFWDDDGNEIPEDQMTLEQKRLSSRRLFKGDISQWNVSNVTNMNSMFSDSQFNGDISQWDVSNVTDMSNMFSSSQFNGDISQWNVSNVTKMNQMFWGSCFDGDISQWDVSNVTSMSGMFYESRFNGDISRWNVSNVTNMRGMFAGDTFLGKKYSRFNGDISQWNVSNVTNMSDMFSYSHFDGDISQWDVSNVTDMSGMFRSSQFNGDISQWNVSNVTDMSRMFWVSCFNGDVSQWNVSKVTNMSSMFRKSQFDGNISQWDVSNVTDMSYMFSKSQFNGDISQWNVSNVTNMGCMFSDCILEKEWKLPGWYKG